MKTRLLLFSLLLASGLLSAQEVIRSLVISEVRLDDARHSYVEIANVGETTLNLSQFEIGVVGPWTSPIDAADLTKWFNVGTGYWFMLPNKDLEPNQTFLIAAVYDWNPEQWAKDPTKGTRVMNKKEFWTIADIQLNFPESPNNDPTDSISPNYHVLENWSGRDCIYLRQHVSPTDSVVIDQVNGIFDEADGTRNDQAADVAGFTAATNNATLVRKFSVKTGNTDFESARGLDLTDSEWMPIPLQFGHWEQFRSLFWTVGNHGDYNLTPSTLTSGTVEINWADTSLIVPWGVRRDDSLMFQFDRYPGFAWHYDYAKTHLDTTFYSVRTGDVFTVYACGNDLDMAKFKITVAPPTADANIVIPKRIPDNRLRYSNWAPTWVVTDKVPGMDTIMEIPYGIRSDTLLKYLEKAPAASWSFEWVDGNARTDLKTGDILKVTAQNGDIKRYYIKPDKFQKSHNASLGSITWPDIPEDYKGLYGWIGDTIPNFSSSKYEFKVQVPYDVNGIPALVGKTADVNAKLAVDRAKNLSGSVSERTVTFTTTAVDDTSHLSYKVLLEKEKDFTNVQPNLADPFISQYVFQDQWANYMLELANPGTEPLDMSNYMIVFSWATSPSDALTILNGTGDWNNRYFKYIPGYKWQTQAAWTSGPRFADQDANVNPIVQPGDVFCLGFINTTGSSGYPWYASQQLDIDFGHNPWGETIGQGNAAGQWYNNTCFVFKITNDSIKEGTKAATDPEDFELIETFGDGTSQWTIGGIPAEQTATYIRKPEFYKGKTGLGESFGTDAASSEWLFYNRAYWDAKGVGWPTDILNDCQGLGSHFMNDVTAYKSTVSSSLYKVSEGYSLEESIRGATTGTTVGQFTANIVKADANETLTFKHLTAELTSDVALTDGDTLIVLSSDASNTTKYVISVLDDGLSSDAVLVSDLYKIEVTGETGSVTGFDYGLPIKTVLQNIEVPVGASLTVIDADNAYLPLQFINFDTLLVDVQVSDKVFFEVIAENGSTKIVYQLHPFVMYGGAFVTSNVFEVNQNLSLINNVPAGTAVYGLLKYLIPAPGATVKIIDKLGYERTVGYVVKDDRIVVTSEDGSATKIYYLEVLNESMNYLAYVSSTLYFVDQVELTIAGSNIATTSVTDFLNNLIPAENATMIVTNADGVQQTGNMAVGYKVVVTSGDENAQATYVVSDNTAVQTQNVNSIKVYPNPSTGMVYISGLEPGNRVFVTNMLGQRLVDRTVQGNSETINLTGQSSGLYFVTVKNGNQLVGHYKLILQ